MTEKESKELSFLILIFITPYILMLLWNYFVYITHLPVISYWEAFGLRILVSCFRPIIQTVKVYKEQ